MNASLAVVLDQPVSTDISTRAKGADLLPTLLSISKSVRALTALTVADIGLSVGQDTLLVAIAEAGQPVSIGQIADRVSVRPSTVSKMADRLAKKKLIERLKDTRDARLTVLWPTEAGEAKAKQVRRLWAEIEVSLTKVDPALDDDEVLASLVAVEDALRRRLSRLR